MRALQGDGCCLKNSLAASIILTILFSGGAAAQSSSVRDANKVGGQIAAARAEDAVYFGRTWAVKRLERGHRFAPSVGGETANVGSVSPIAGSRRSF